MTPLHLAVLLLGIFGVPLWLLFAGHRVWRRSPLHRRFFRGAVFGHCIATMLATFLAVLPPHMWAANDIVRGALGVWSLVVLPLLGGALDVAIHNSNRDGDPDV